MELLDELNDEQRRAVTAGDGPVLIVAGPGTGKTKTLTARIAYLLSERHVPTADIVALTFTNKAAAEMRERLSTVLGKGAKLPKITTFHALGHDLLKREDVAKAIITEQQRKELIRGIAKPAALKGVNLRELSLLISNVKTTLDAALPDDAAELVRRYEAALAAQDLHDFDDLLCKAFALLREDTSKRPGYRYVLVDEFQDTSELQYALLKLLGTTDNLLAIGDPNQSIYSFRGAGAEMFDTFRADFPHAQAIDLTTNYRSCPQVVTLANAIFPHSPQLETHRTENGSIRAIQTLNEFSEAAYVLEAVEHGIGGSDMLKASGHNDVHEPRDYAVLYRTHRAARALQRTFAESGVPYQIAGEGSPYEQAETQAVVAIMRAVQQPDEVHKQALGALPALHRPSLAQTDALLAKFPFTPAQTVHELATHIISELGFDQDAAQFAALRQFLGTLVQFGACERGLAACLEHIDYISEQEFYDASVNAVTLLTIHAAKGLEFKHVFLCAAEEGILPKLNAAGAGDIDEERRLFYVAVTRAKHTLDILHAKKRGGEPTKPSRFITSLPTSVLPQSSDLNMATLEKRAEKRRLKRAQGSLF